MKTREELIAEIDAMIEEQTTALNERVDIIPEDPMLLAGKAVGVAINMLMREVFTQIRELAETEINPLIIIANGLRIINTTLETVNNGTRLDWMLMEDDPADPYDEHFRDMASSFLDLAKELVPSFYDGIPGLLDPEGEPETGIELINDPSLNSGVFHGYNTTEPGFIAIDGGIGWNWTPNVIASLQDFGQAGDSDLIFAYINAGESNDVVVRYEGNAPLRISDSVDGEFINAIPGEDFIIPASDKVVLAFAEGLVIGCEIHSISVKTV